MTAIIAWDMGIDKPDVYFVAHLDLPKSPKTQKPENLGAYYQETSRSGRDDEPANTWVIYGLQDVARLRHLLTTTPHLGCATRLPQTTGRCPRRTTLRHLPRP